MQTKDLTLRIWPLFIVFFLYNFIALAMTQYFGRDELHLFINQFHSPFFDSFFKFYTDFGTTVIFIALVLYVIIKHNWITFGYIALSQIVASIINIAVKKIFFKHVHRPSYYFYQKHTDLYLAEGEKLQIPYTFPSGHTLMAVIIAMTLCVLVKNRFLQLLIALQIPIIGFSRIYLSKHFAIDTIGGAFVGFFSFIFVYYLLNNSTKQFLSQPILKKKWKIKN